MLETEKYFSTKTHNRNAFRDDYIRLTDAIAFVLVFQLPCYSFLNVRDRVPKFGVLTKPVRPPTSEREANGELFDRDQQRLKLRSVLVEQLVLNAAGRVCWKKYTFFSSVP